MLDGEQTQAGIGAVGGEAVTFDEVLEQALEMLQRRGRVSYRALKVQFQLDDALLEILKDEIVEVHQLARDQEGKMLVWTGDATAPTVPTSAPAPDAGRTPLTYTPSYLAEKILTSRPALAGERKQVTVFFADIKDSTKLIEGLDPEAAQQLLDPAIHLMMDAVHRYEGTVNQVLGDGIMALFGAPLAHEDHALRARYELDMQLALGRALQRTRGWGIPEVGQAWTRARELCRQVGDTPQLLRVLGGLASFHQQRAELQTAWELWEQHLILAQGQQDPAVLMEAHVNLGICLYFLGELASAETHLALAIVPSAPQPDCSPDFRHDSALSVLCLGYIAWTLVILGYADQALARMHEMLTQAQEVSHAFTLTRSLYYAAVLHRNRREGAAARERAEAALALVTEQGFGHYAGAVTFEWGCALAAQGQYEEGLTQMYQGLADTRGQVGESMRLAQLAAAYGASAQVEEGLRLLDEALAHVDHTGERFYAAEVYRLKGELLLRQAVPDTPQAEACFHQALDVACQQQAKSWELRAAISLSRLWQEQGKRAAARELLAPIYSWFTEGLDTADLQEARALLEDLGT